MNKLFFITGASGAGKTTAVNNLEKSNPTDLVFCYFDSIGVPSNEEMVEKYGGGEGWQKATTHVWVKKIKAEILDSKSCILDGQIRPAFIEEACWAEGVANYEVILFDCSDDERAKRLTDRGHADLANVDMMNWAKYLRDESIARHYTIIDNTNFTEAESLGALKKCCLSPK